MCGLQWVFRRFVGVNCRTERGLVARLLAVTMTVAPPGPSTTMIPHSPKKRGKKFCGKRRRIAAVRYTEYGVSCGTVTQRKAHAVGRTSAGLCAPTGSTRWGGLRSPFYRAMRQGGQAMGWRWLFHRRGLPSRVGGSRPGLGTCRGRGRAGATGNTRC